MNFPVDPTAENPIEKANRLAKVGQAALRTLYPGARAMYAQMAGQQPYRFEVCIPNDRFPEQGETFVIQFSALESQATGQTDEGWGKAFLDEVTKRLQEAV
jgi:hypothetical protein